MPTALFGAPGRYLGLVTLLDNAVFALGVSIFVRTRRDQLAVGAAALSARMIALAYVVAAAACLVGIVLRRSRTSVLALEPVAAAVVVLRLRQYPGPVCGSTAVVASGAFLAVLAARLPSP